jgi:hypothetical protein
MATTVTGSVSFKDALERDAVALIEDTPSADYMEGQAERVKEKYIKNLKMTLDTANVEDAEEMMQDLMANVASSNGIKASVDDVQKWANMTFDELAQQVDSSGVSLRVFANETAMASAQIGLDVASSTYGESYQMFNVTSGVLEDGKLSVGEAVQLGASAVSFASTMVAGLAGGAALGPIGAIAGLVIAGISYLFTSASAQEAAWRKELAKAREAASLEEQKITAFNTEQRDTYKAYSDLVWKAKDSAISEVADNWAAFEEDLGVRFGLRYFPGAPPPRRAGFYQSVYLGPGSYSISKQYRSSDNDTWLPILCETLSGCPYFPEPHPEDVKNLGYDEAYLKMLEGLKAKGLYLFDPNGNIDSQYVMNSETQYPPQLDYFNRTIRAFDAFTSGRFWVPEGQRVQAVAAKDYRDLALDVICGRSSDLCFNGRRLNYCDDLAFAKGSCRYNDADRNSAFNELVRMKAKGIEYDIQSRSMQFWQTLMQDLADQGSNTDVFKTRITGDLIQTSNAVGGEMATSLRLRDLMNKLGTTDIRKVSQSEKRGLTAIPTELKSKIDRVKQRDGMLNGGMLLAGMSALGFGAYKKWG